MVCTCIGKERSSISITASPTTVTVGENITLSGSINVTRVGVTVYLLHREVGESWTPLEEVTTNSTSQYLYDWNTTSSELGTYEVKAYWLGDADTYGNESSPVTVDVVGVHDVAVKNVVPSPTEVAVGETVDVDVTVKNEGDYAETFDVHVYSDIDTAVIGDEIDVGTISGITLSPGGSTVRRIIWDTASVSEGTYTISGEASQVLGETDTADNIYEDGTVNVALANQPPVASFTYLPLSPVGNETVSFNATASDDPDGTIVEYEWDFGDGTNATLVTATVDHAYADNGTYTVVLSVTDDGGLSNATSMNVTVLNRPPIVIFTESTEIVYTGEAITFNASDSYDSDGSIVSYFWDFGDETNATGVTTEHSYPLEGDYTVTLTVTDDDDATNSTSASKTVLNRPPVAVFTESAENVYTNETIYFNASDSHDSDGNITSYFWEFGDGTNDTGVVVEHAYADDGNYTVTLTVTDDDGATGTATATKTVQNRPPVAIFTESAETAYVGEAITFNASDSYDLDGTITSYFWDFGDGTNTTGVIVNHAYDIIQHNYIIYIYNGTFTVTLTVTDDDGTSNSSSSTKTILTNEPPVALFTASAETVYTGEVTTFNASDSYDPDGNIASYFWDFGDRTNATGVTVDHAYADHDVYTVTLFVTDDAGETASKSVVKTVSNRPPIALFTQNATTVDIDELIRFDASSSYDADGSIFSYFWDFGDGTNVTMAVVLDHIYNENGNYTATLTVTDDDGASSSYSATITVNASSGWPLPLIAGVVLGIPALAGAVILVVFRGRKKTGK